MRLQIDTKARIIRLEEKVLLKELVVTLERLLPKKEWQTFTLETDTVINNWSSPIIIRDPVPNTYPYTYPWYSTGVYVSNDANKTTSYDVGNPLNSGEYKLIAGTYNVEV